MLAAVTPFDSADNRLQMTLIRLAKDEFLWQGDLHGALRDITSTVANTLDVERASVWLLNPDRTLLTCRLRFRASLGSFESGASLKPQAVADYLQQLDNHHIIAVDDSAQDTRLSSFNEHLAPAERIGALLCAALYGGGNLVGALCVATDNESRPWLRKEIDFVRAVADLLSQLLVFHALRDSERGYRMLFDAAGDSILTFRNGLIVDCNHRAAALFGLQRSRLIGYPPEDLSPPFQPDGQRSEEKMALLVQKAIESGPQVFDWSYQRLDGSVFETEVSLSALWSSNECSTMAIVRDITERRRAETLLRASTALLERRNRILQVVGDLASHLHRTTNAKLIAEETLKGLQQLQRSPLSMFHLINPNTEHFELLASVGYSAEQIALCQTPPLGSSLTALALASRQILRSSDLPQDSRIDERIRQFLIAQGIQSITILPLLYQSEPLGAISLQYYEHGDEFSEGELDTLRAICETVSLALANARNVQVLEYQALHDSLTGLPNRSQLHRATAETLRSNVGGHHIALMLLDLDKFKEVNDTLGHRTGDQLLKLVAERLQAALTPHDTLLARLGGDEFAILLRHCEGSDHAISVAGVLAAALRQPLEVEGIFIELGASIGVAVYPQHGGTSHALLRCADVAMYAAKSQSLGVSLYNSTYDAHNPRRLAMITDLGNAIRRDQLIVYFQPRYDLATRQWCGCEALLRWQHPTLGFIPPGEFVQFAETSELIRPLTLLVARHAIAQLHRWHDAGMPIIMSVNLSTRNLLDITLPAALAELLAEYHLPSAALELEITETALMTDPERAMQVIDQIAQLGMRLSIDDFGTGYSSLAYLKRLPLHALKIDRSFVMDMLDDEQDAIIVKSTVGLAHSLGLRVIAEGVETAEALHKLREFGCEEAQGYLLSKPLPAEAAFATMQTKPDL